jgi:glycosyltransferase involved in cell wall biosynthesis
MTQLAVEAGTDAKMKIAQITPYFLPVEGGVERHVLNLSHELVRRGHEVEIFTCARTRQNEVLDRSSVVEGLPVSRFESMFSIGEFGRVWPGFAREVMKGDFDVVHSHSFRHPHTDISMLVSKMTGSASVLTAHSPFHPGEVRGRFARALVPVYDNLFAPTTLAYFDKVISLTDEEAGLLARLGVRSDQRVVIPHGVDAVHFSRADPSLFVSKYRLEGRDIALCLSRINRTKGLDVLLEAFASIADMAPNLTLVLAGEPTSRKEEGFLGELKSRREALGLQGRVVFTGRLTDEEKASAYEACMVFVLPSIYEPYGIVLLEAAAHGKPLISTRAGGPTSIVDEGINGLLVTPGANRELAAALIRLATDKELAERMGGEARQMASEHTWERVARATERAYHSVDDRVLAGREIGW